MTHKTIFLKNNIAFLTVLIFFWFGVIFYDFIQHRFGFSFIDEFISLFCLFCITYFAIVKRGKIRRVSLIVLSIIIFYFIYSLSIKSNTYRAIVSDFIVVTKPLIAMLFIWELNPHFSIMMRRILSISSIIASIYIAIIGFLGDPAIYYLFGHPSRLATTALLSAFLYFISNKFNRKTVLMFILMVSLSLLSFRSKAYGISVIVILPLLVFYKQLSNNTFRFRLRYSIVFLMLLSMVIAVAWPKIYFYFVVGTENPEKMFARPALFLTALKIVKDYFPFGSGLASFASHFSAKYYSSIYYQYNLSHLQGLSEDMPSFISDSFFPQLLGQFGFAGLMLFISGFLLIMKKSYKYYLTNKKGGNYLYLIYCILAFLVIESVADSTFVQNRGMFIMILLGIALQKLHGNVVLHKKEKS